MIKRKFKVILESSRFSLSFKKYARRVLSLFLCTSMMLCLCSCWNRRELSSLAIVLGVAIDKGSTPDSLEMTAQIVKPGEIKAGSSADESAPTSKAYVNMSNTDKTVLSALRGITHMSNRTLYYSHNQIIIFSREVAENDISEGLDTFLRNNESRMNVHMIISKGRASEVLQEENGLEKVPAVHLSELLVNQKISSEAVDITLRDFSIATLSGTTAPVVPMIELYEPEESKGKKSARLDGTAVFKNNKMVGELNRDETRGLLWVTGKVKIGVLNLETEWGEVSYEVSNYKSSFKPVKTKDGSIHMKLNYEVMGCIQVNETDENMTKEEHLDVIKALVKDHIKTDIEGTQQKARELSADVFGFGESIRNNYPDEWKKMKADWDENFKGIEIDIEPTVMIHCTGSLINPVIPGGSQ